METEIVDEIQEYSTASLHVNETKNVLNRKDEVLKENYNEKKTKLASTDAFDASGQVVPSQSCLKSETDTSQNNEHLTVPKASLEAMDCLEKSQNFLKQSEINQDKLILEDPEEYAMKTFHWPPIGFKEQINVVKTIKPGIFDQVVSHTNEVNKDNEDSIGKQVAQTNTISCTLSNETNPAEEESSLTEYHNLTSILKKDNNQAKKTVHFRENIVSVKFYDISDEEDSDNDTVILSDPEDDDFRDQEVPFNTYDDYNNVYYPSSISLNFIPQFTFPPVLKIANCELYDTIDDTDEQILAIMEDNDGRQHPDDLTTDKIHPEEGISCSHNDHVTSKEVFSTNLDKMFHEESTNEHQNDQITPRKLSENIEEALEFSEIQTPLAKNGIDHSDVNALKNISGTFETETLLGNQQTSTNVKIVSRTSDEKLEKSTAMTQHGIEQQTRNDDQHYFIKADDTKIDNPEEMKAPAIEIRQFVSYEDTNDLQDGQGTCKDVNALIETQAEANEMKEAPTKIGLPVTDIAGPSEENMVSKLELIADDKARPTQVNVPGESKESSKVEVTPSTSSGRLAFHGNCGSSLLWRGPRSINSLILDEDFEVFTTPSAEKEIVHQHSLTKEEITTPKIPLTNIESLELNILPGMWSVATEHCDKELKLEKYDHSFLSSPDHVNEFEETWEPAIKAEFPNKKQKMNFDQSNELWLKHGYLHSDTGAEQYETEFQEHPKTKIRSVASLERENVDDTFSVNQDMHNLTTQIVPDMYNGQEQLKPMNDLSRVVPSGAEDVLMDSTNTALQCSRQSYKTLEDVKSCITPYHQDLSSQTKHGRRKLRVGLSKSTKVKSLHPYWSKERIKESGTNS